MSRLRSFPVRPVLAALFVAAHLGASATVLDPPSLRCASVDLAGNVTLTWVVPPDPTAEFLQYDIYHASALAGPYLFVSSIPVYAQTTYVDAGAGADSGAQFYYVTTTSTGADVSAPSDTLSTIFLQVTQSTPLGSAVLDWNLPTDPVAATANDEFLIRREYPLNTWSLIDSVANTLHHYSQVISICQDSLTYRIALPDASGCTSTSNFTGDEFQDVTPPTIPVVVNVTVDTTTNQTIVTWAPSPELDTDGYIIVLVTETGNIILDTLYGRLNNTFDWVFGDAGGGSESFTIAAIDTCWKGTPPSPNTSATNPAHSTVFAYTEYDRCVGDIRVRWTPYVGWPVVNYALYVRVDGAAPILVSTFGPNTLSYLAANVDPFRQYVYIVKAIGAGAGQTSLSNKTVRVTDYPAVPQWNYIRTATVIDENHISVVDSVDQTAPARRYHLQRTYNGEPWQEIASVAGGPSGTIVFDDLDVLTQERSYTYRVLVDDSCGSPAVTSNVGTSILLQASADLDGYDRLRWNGYVQWGGSVSGYVLRRSIDDGPFDPIAFLPPDPWEYADDVRSFTGTTGRFCYYLEAVETGNPSGINAISTSNAVCAVQQEEVWIPNAFIAGGVNDRFKPVLAYVDVKEYEFTIFNRWGQQIWTTNDPDQPWDGRVDGIFVPQGVFAYYCSFKNGAAKQFVQRGTVTFLHASD